MLEIAIVGGGLCGLVLADRLRQRGADFALFEARRRLGGRIFSAPSARTGMAMDLGPTWFWPATQPMIAQLISDLGLSQFPQHDSGAVLTLRDPDKRPEAGEGEGVHAGAFRVEGGMTRLVDALGYRLPQERLYLGHVLTRVRDLGDCVALTFRVADQVVEITARQVVLATPPRLLEEQVAFEPELDPEIVAAMRETGAWMAAQAKVVFAYDRAHWREAGRSGAAFVTHDQAVVGEIYDACDPAGGKAALGGFLALTPELRQSFRAGLPMLMGNQIGQVFGPELEHGEQHYQDWATERYTCSALDLSAPRSAEHQRVANPLLKRAHWGGKLFLGGSETAAREAGYLEGAVAVAARLDQTVAQTKQTLGANMEFGVKDGLPSRNQTSLAEFSAWVAAQDDPAFDGYRRRLNRALAAQEREQLTQRALLDTVEDVFDQALGVLDGLPFDMANVAVERGRSALTPHVQTPFSFFLQTLFDDVVAFNQTSCALSNFSDEHRLPHIYRQTILRDIAAAWQEFSLAANNVLLSKAARQDAE